MAEPNKDSIKNFLRQFKNIQSTGRGLDIIPRKENIQALSELGLTIKNCKEEILTLSVADYCEGPLPDKEKGGEVWIFGKYISGNQVYIKLKIAEVGKEKIAKCLSFHAARYPLCFPCQEKPKERREKK